MPACFQLIDKTTNKPEVLQRIDELLCEHFNVPCDPDQWYHYWYETIGFCLACGKTFDEIRTRLRNDQQADINCGVAGTSNRMLEIVDWLEERYTPNAFYQPK